MNFSKFFTEDCFNRSAVQYCDFCRTADEVMENSEAGHLMRTKYLGVNEGGVNTGFSCLDTPFLIE